jgi:hypothetical protein
MTLPCRPTRSTSASGWAVRHESGTQGAEAIAPKAVAPAEPDVAVVDPEAEAQEVIGTPTGDDLEQALVDAFGPVTTWWTGELPGLGVMHLPLP